MSRLTPIYTIYGLLYTAFDLGGRHNGLAWPGPDRPAIWPVCWGALDDSELHWYFYLHHLFYPSRTQWRERVSSPSKRYTVHHLLQMHDHSHVRCHPMIRPYMGQNIFDSS
jgi:hypothetical protein